MKTAWAAPSAQTKHVYQHAQLKSPNVKKKTIAKSVFSALVRNTVQKTKFLSLMNARTVNVDLGLR